MCAWAAPGAVACVCLGPGIESDILISGIPYMSPMSTSRTPSTHALKANHGFGGKDQSTDDPWLCCDACERNCAISPFDGFLGFGVHCLSEPEDVNRSSGARVSRVAES
jgi:hypothetical protein